MMQNPKKILLAFSGGKDSVVAAFLLKNQGYDVSALCFQFLSGADKDNIGEDFSKSCNVEDLKEARRVAEELNIPFYAVNGISQFEGSILDFAVANRIQGKTISTCSMCNTLKLKILAEKAEILKCDTIATGHYAKIHRLEDNSNVSIYSSNDKEFDQAHLLSQVPQKYLKNLIFPLGDLRRKEVNEIIERYSLEYIDNPKKPENCFVQEVGFTNYVESKSHETLRTPASFFNSKIGTHAGDNRGIHAFFTGQSQLKTENKAQTFDKKLTIVKLDTDSKEIFLDDSKRLYKSGVILRDLNFAKGFDRSRPLTVFVPRREDINSKKDGNFKLKKTEKVELKTLEYLNGEIQFKNNNTALLLMDEKVYNFTIGYTVSLFIKSGKNNKLLGSGIVQSFEDFHLYDPSSNLSKKEESRIAQEKKIADENPNIISLDLDDMPSDNDEKKNIFNF